MNWMQFFQRNPVAAISPNFSTGQLRNHHMSEEQGLSSTNWHLVGHRSDEEFGNAPLKYLGKF